MSFTLGSLRTFCREEASKDASGSTSERAFMHWINGALSRLYREQLFDLTSREVKVTVPPANTTIADGVVTQNSLAISSATGFTAAWLSERWGLHIEGETRFEFELGAIGSPATTATLRAGDEWIADSGTAKDFVFVKNKFLLSTAAEILDVQVLDGHCVAIVSPKRFDELKNGYPTHRAEFPRIATLRNNYLEIWPSPSSNYQKLIVTYRLAYTPLSSAAAADGGDADATTISWPDEHLDVLKKAIMLEAALSQGPNAPVPFPLAKLEYEGALLKLRAVGTKDMQPGPLQIVPPILGRRRTKRAFMSDQELEDV